MWFNRRTSPISHIITVTDISRFQVQLAWQWNWQFEKREREGLSARGTRVSRTPGRQCAPPRSLHFEEVDRSPRCPKVIPGGNRGEGVMRTCRPPSWNKMELNVDGNPAHRDPPAPRRIDGPTLLFWTEAVLMRRLRYSSTCFTCVVGYPVLYFVSIIFNGWEKNYCLQRSDFANWNEGKEYLLQ